jgi:hypothetical protein
MRMHNPPHPGELIKALCLEPLGVTVTQGGRSSWGKPQDTVRYFEWPCGYHA